VVQVPFGALHNFSQSWHWPLGGHFHGAILILSLEALSFSSLDNFLKLLLCDAAMLPHLLKLLERDFLALLQEVSH